MTVTPTRDSANDSASGSDNGSESGRAGTVQGQFRHPTFIQRRPGQGSEEPTNFKIQAKIRKEHYSQHTQPTANIAPTHPLAV